MPWSYIRSSISGDDQIGPVSDAEFAKAIKDRHVKPKTKVNGGPATKGQWVEARAVSAFNRVLETIKEDKANRREQMDVARNQARAIHAADRKANAVQRAREKATFMWIVWVVSIGVFILCSATIAVVFYGEYLVGAVGIFLLIVIYIGAFVFCAIYAMSPIIVVFQLRTLIKSADARNEILARLIDGGD